MLSLQFRISRRLRYLWLALFASLLVALNGCASAAPFKVVEPTATPVAIVRGAARAVTLSLTLALAPNPVEPSATPSPTSFPIATLTHTPTPSPAPRVTQFHSPDGRWTAQMYEEQGSLVLRDSDGEEQTIFPPGSTVGEVQWSPDSRRLLVVRTYWLNEVTGDGILATGPTELWQILVEGNQVSEPALLFEPEPLLFKPEGSDEERDIPTHIDFGSWSPDSRHIVFWFGMRSASLQADGLPPTILNVETGEATTLADSLLLNPRYHSWSPSGAQMALTLGGYRSAQVGKRLALYESSTGMLTTVISETVQVPGIVSWSPRGDMIAYAAVPAALTGPEFADWMLFENQAIAGRRVYLYEIATGQSRRLNADELFQDAPVWSEDGATLYYVQRLSDAMMLMAADPRTGTAQPVVGVEEPAPRGVGYYGQSDWESLLAQIPETSPILSILASSSAQELPASIISLDVDPLDSQMLYALLTSNLLYKSDDGGQTWRELPLPSVEQVPEEVLNRSVFILPQQDVRTVPGRPGQLFARTHNGQTRSLFRSDDGGARWQSLWSGVAAWTMANASGDTLYVWHPDYGMRDRNGLYRSDDAGTTWQQVYQGFFPPSIQNEPFAPNHEGITSLLTDPFDASILYAGTDFGLYRSVDGGQSWVDFNTGLPHTVRAYRWVPILVAGRDGTIFAKTNYSRDNQSLVDVVVRWRPGEEAWTTIYEAPDGDVESLLADPLDANRLYLGTERGLLASEDGGESWDTIALPSGQVTYRISVAPGKPSLLYLWTDEGLVMTEYPPRLTTDMATSTPAPGSLTERPPILDVFPMMVGTTWVYSVTTETIEDGETLVEHGVITETVTEGRQEGVALIFRVTAEQSGAEATNVFSERQYIAIDNRLYEWNSQWLEDELVASEGEGFESNQMVTWPLHVGQRWGALEYMERAAGHVWEVVSSENVQTPAGAWSGCHELVFQASDQHTNWFCAGMGKVRFEHLQPAFRVVMELQTFSMGE